LSPARPRIAEPLMMFVRIKRLLAHVVTYGSANAAMRIAGFLLIPVYSRYLTPADYGVLSLVAMLGEVLFALMNVGQGSAMFRTYFRHDDLRERETVIMTSLWLLLTLSLPVGLLAVAAARPLAAFLTGSPDYASWVILGIAGIMFKTLFRLPLTVLRAREDSARYAGLMFAQALVALVLAIIFVVGLHFGGRGVLLSQLLAEVAICACLVPVIFKGLPRRFSRSAAADLLGYGLALVPATLLSFLRHQSDRYLLKYFMSVSMVGIYALGYRFGEALYFVMFAFELAYPQFLYRHLKHDGAPALYARVCTYYLAVMGLLWLAVAMLAEEIVRIMAHPTFHEASVVVPWIAGAFLLQALGHVGNVGMQIHRVLKYRLLINGIATGASIGLNLLLIPAYGMQGAAAAAVLSAAVQFVLQIVVGYRLYPVPYEYGRLARLAVVGVLTYTVGSHIALGSISTALTGKMVLLLCTPLLLYVSGFFERGELRRVDELLKSFGRISSRPAAQAGKVRERR
jgi:O-antigen/teichoic acid export membrane protein